jgi:hypothetical protein
MTTVRLALAPVFVLGAAVLLGGHAAADEREDAIVAAMRLPADEVRHALQTSPWRDEPLFLAGVAQNPAATSEILDAIARRPDPNLHEKLYGSDRVLGKNRKGLAVMRLVALHPNVTEATLVHLAESRNDYVLNTVLANPKTPEPVLRRYAGRGNYLYDWGIASNARTPPDLLVPLASSANEYTRAMIARNPRTPPDVLARLAGDRTWHVRRDVALNPNALPVTLVALSGDPDERVRRTAERSRKQRAGAGN